MLELQDAGTAVFSVLDGGNVGIGLTNPSSKLHVVGDTRIEGNLTVNGTQTIVNTNVGTTEQLVITNDGTGPALVVNQKGSQPVIDVQDDGVSVLKIIDGGNVGLGTTQPLQKLHVHGTLLATTINGAIDTQYISSGTLGIERGGTGASTLAANKLIVGNGTIAVLQPTNLHWDNTSSRLGVGASGATEPGKGNTDTGLSIYATGQLHSSTVSTASTFARNSTGAAASFYSNGIECGGMEVNINGSLTLQGTTNLFLEGTSSVRSATIRDNTTANAGNVWCSSSSGALGRSTSSIKYKTNVQTLTNEAADNILNCRPVVYNSKSTLDNPAMTYYGFIAEEVVEIDPRLVHYSEDNEPEGVQYDRFVPHLINIIKRLEQRIVALENKN